MNNLDFHMIKILEDKLKYLYLYRYELKNKKFLWIQNNQKKIDSIDKEIEKYDNLLMEEYLKLERTKK